MLILLTPLSQAWLLFEPIIGYNKGQEQGSQVQGIGLGARLGIEYRNFFIAADIGNHDVQQSSLNSVTYSDSGVSLGGRINAFRFWYGLISSSSFTFTSGATTTTVSGSGTKFGIGGAIGNNLFLNLESRTCNYTQNSTAGVSTVISELGTLGFLSISWVL